MSIFFLRNSIYMRKNWNSKCWNVRLLFICFNKFCKYLKVDLRRAVFLTTNISLNFFYFFFLKKWFIFRNNLGSFFTLSTLKTKIVFSFSRGFPFNYILLEKFTRIWITDFFLKYLRYFKWNRKINGKLLRYFI